MTIYDKIKEKSIELGMSQADLANKMGYTSRSSIAKIESGSVDIPQSKISAFAKALNTTTAYLMELDDKIHTIAAHHEGGTWTEEELSEIEEFKKYVLSKRKKD